MELMNSEPPNAENHAVLTDLPCEIIEQIISCVGISHVDVCRISQVCHKLFDIASSRRVWHAKFCQAWGSLSGLYDGSTVNWKEEYQQRLKYGKHAQELVTAMYEQSDYPQLADGEFYKFKELSEEHRFASHFMLDELDSILYGGESYLRLTTKYYCSKLLHFARQHHGRKVFQDFLVKYEICHQPLDIGVTIISQFCQPIERIMYKDISRQLDNFAMQVKQAVKNMSPKHPVLHKDIIPTSTVLRESLWSPSDCRIILMCINSTLFNSLFECICEDEGFSSDEILIDKVLEGTIGIPVVIAVIYSSVAHRLGVVCELCEPDTTALKWVEHPMLDKANMYTFIDISKSGKFFTAAEFSIAKKIHTCDEIEFPSKLPSQIFKDVIRSLTHSGRRDLHCLEERLLYESSALELDLILCPNDKEKILMLVQLYLQMDTRLFEVKDLLLRVTPQDPYLSYRVARLYVEMESRMKLHYKGAKNEPPKKKLRENSQGVSFAIGMIMKHKKYDYVCVIYGWDEFCRASDYWIQQMRVFELKNRDIQPFYNVLVEDGTQRYAAQENLEIYDSPRFIKHPDVGKYFDEYKKTHFVPNERTSAEYPQDATARETMLGEFFSARHCIYDIACDSKR